MKNTTSEFSNFSDVLKYIINDDKYGESALRNRERTENIINDLVPDSFQKEKKLLGDAYYCKVIRLMLDANSSSGKHDIALNSAKIKLVKDAGMSEESAVEILKCISFALGWKEDIKSNKENNSPTSSMSKQKDDTELNASAEKEIAFYGEAKPQEKKKKKFPIVILLLIAILVCIIWPFGREEEDNSVIDEDTIAETEDTTAIPNISAANESVEMESKSIVVEEVPAEEEEAEEEEEEPVAEEEETENVPSEEEVVDEPVEDELAKYIISEIDSADWGNLHEFITHTAYVPQSNLFYYLNVTGEELYCYNLETEEREVVLSISQIRDLCEENWPQNESSQTLLTSSDSENEICVYGLLFNPYNNEIYVCGFFPDKSYGEKKWWFYDVSDDSFSFGFTFADIRLEDSRKDDILYKNRIFFVSEEEYIYLNSSSYSSISGDAYICKIGEETVDFNVGFWHGLDYLIDHNDTYYIIICLYQEAYLYEVGSVYSAPEFLSDDEIRLFYKENVSVSECTGFCYYNGYLYMKDEYNDIYVIDIDNLTKDLYISYADMEENGKLFLGDEACFGLHMTNDGGYITFDSSNRKIKYVKFNN